MRERTDDSLLLATARGDEAAFAELVARHRPRLVRYATSRCGRDVGLAEDAVQDGLVRAHRAIVGGKVPRRRRGVALRHRAQPLPRLLPRGEADGPAAAGAARRRAVGLRGRRAGRTPRGRAARGRAPAARPAHRAGRSRARGPQLRGARAPPGDDGVGGQVPAAPCAGDAGPPGLAAGVRDAARRPRGTGAPRPDRDGHDRRARDRRRGHRDHRPGGHERARLAARPGTARGADRGAVAGGAQRGRAPAAAGKPPWARRSTRTEAAGARRTRSTRTARPRRFASTRLCLVAPAAPAPARGGGEYGP